jgi:hypothetical protein
MGGQSGEGGEGIRVGFRDGTARGSCERHAARVVFGSRLAQFSRVDSDFLPVDTCRGRGSGKDSGLVICRPNGEDPLTDCPENYHGCIEPIDTVVWSSFVDQETSLS